MKIKIIEFIHLINAFNKLIGLLSLCTSVSKDLISYSNVICRLFLFLFTENAMKDIRINCAIGVYK